MKTPFGTNRERKAKREKYLPRGNFLLIANVLMEKPYKISLSK